MSWKDIGKAIAGQMESTARSRARANKNTPLGEEYSRFADGMKNVQDSPLLNSKDVNHSNEDEW